MERTGHRSVEGIRTYKRTSDKLKELSSNILNHDNKRVKVVGNGAVSKCDVIHFVISLKPDRPYKATVVYNFATVVYSDIPWQTVVYQLYTTARGFDVSHAKCYI